MSEVKSEWFVRLIGDWSFVADLLRDVAKDCELDDEKRHELIANARASWMDWCDDDEYGSGDVALRNADELAVLLVRASKHGIGAAVCVRLESGATSAWAALPTRHAKDHGGATVNVDQQAIAEEFRASVESATKRLSAALSKHRSGR